MLWTLNSFVFLISLILQLLIILKKIASTLTVPNDSGFSWILWFLCQDHHNFFFIVSSCPQCITGSLHVHQKWWMTYEDLHENYHEYSLKKKMDWRNSSLSFTRCLFSLLHLLFKTDAIDMLQVGVSGRSCVWWAFVSEFKGVCFMAHV